jgi:hypothetical protein
MIYEYLYQTQVDDFGCIQHDKYSFIGASPDGIVVNEDSCRFGRMLEIKNVVSREITGTPKKEYWVQMQLQMEVCDLNECDFLETKFIEYESKTHFDKDIQLNNNDKNICISSDGKRKGIIIQFFTKEGKPFYKYKPLNIIDEDSIQTWEHNILDIYQSQEYNYTFIKFIYWKLDVFSCVLVLRNKEWFNSHIHILENVWKTIEKERISGYEHRAPMRKQKKESNNGNDGNSSGCLLKIIKLNS